MRPTSSPPEREAYVWASSHVMLRNGRPNCPRFAAPKIFVASSPIFTSSSKTNPSPLLNLSEKGTSDSSTMFFKAPLKFLYPFVFKTAS